MSVKYETFVQWFENADSLSQQLRYTIESVLAAITIEAPHEILTTLANLTKLRLWSYNICDLTPLSGLTNLKELELDGHSRELELDANLIEDITPISNLTSLTNLIISRNQLRDISSISALTNLTELTLFENLISDITPISGLTNLRRLDLGDNRLTEVTPLSGLINLTYLDLSSNFIQDISPLTTLTNLTRLCLSANAITDLRPISGLINITNLYLSGNKITDISPLSSFSNLIFLDLSGNRIQDVMPLMALNKLTILKISGNKIIDLNPLLTLANLEIRWNDIDLPRKYWQPIEKWSSTWILEETNAELRRLLIQQIGYETVCQDLEAIELDHWREYCLLKISMFSHFDTEEDIYLLKMTCPSTSHFHVLRVPPPPVVNSAKEAIIWINWGIDPEQFSKET